jgi:CheY-like chemotaxis protein
MSVPSEKNGTANKSLRLIIIDDNPSWCTILGHMVRGLGHTLDVANTLEEAKIKIEDAEKAGIPYSVAIIDMSFIVEGLELVRGQEAIEHIKTHHSYMGCIVASGAMASPDRVLDLRDDYGLDYYVQKDRIEINVLRKALRKAMERVDTISHSQLPLEELPAPPKATERAGAADKQQPPLPTPSPSIIQVALDFQLHKRGAQITWRTLLVGREVTLFAPPYNEVELPLVIRALDTVQYPNYPNPSGQLEQRRFSFTDGEQAILIAKGLWRNNRVLPNAHQIVGHALYNALGAEGQAVLKAIRNTSIAQRQTTSYVLRFPTEGISLAALPWELLWDSEKNQAVLIRGNSIDSCERYIDIDMAIPPPLETGQRLHLLALSPRYRIPDDIREKERAARLQTWDKLQSEGKITYAEISPLTMTALNDYLLSAPNRPDVIHYFGHGVYRNGQGYLLFDDGMGGQDLVSTEHLAAALGDVRLVVIHACQSAMVDEDGGLLTGIAPALSVVAGAVVAMQLTVRIASATRFAQIFYDQLLGRGRSLQEAVARGRHVLFTETRDGASWYVPTLYIRSRDQQPVYLLR